MCSPNVHYDSLLGTTPSNRIDAAAFGRTAVQRGFGRKEDQAHESSRLPDKPTLYHTINHEASVLSLAVDGERNQLYSGSEAGYITVWDLSTFQQCARLEGHAGSVLALEVAPEKKWLFSSSGDNTVRVWDTLTLSPVFIVQPAEDNVGDIFALKWCAELETLYLGCQNTSIQWIYFGGFGRSNAAIEAKRALALSTDGRDSPMLSTPDLVARPHKFFDSVPVALSRSGMGSAGSSTPNRGRSSTASFVKPSDEHPLSNSELASKSASTATDKVLNKASQRLNGTTPATGSYSSPHVDGQADYSDEATQTLLVPPTSSVPSAHIGYVYCFALLTLEGDINHPTVLASGSGDETIKLWHATEAGLSSLAVLESPNADGNAVMALASWSTTLFAGLQGGEVEVWDLETCALVRTIRAHTDDVLCLQTCPDSGFLFTASADGSVRKWDRSFRCIDRFEAHKGIVLSLAMLQPKAENADDAQEPGSVCRLVTGSSDNLIRVWDVANQDPLESRRKAFERFSVDTPPAPSLTPVLGSQSSNGPELPASVTSVPEWSYLLSLLGRFIAIPSISSSDDHQEDCRQAAHFLKTSFQELGAEARVVSNQVGRNPLVLATFSANAYRSGYRRRSSRRPDDVGSNGGSNSRSQSASSSNGFGSERDSNDGLSSSIMFDHPDDLPSQKRTRCLFYGHYDCIAAEGPWDSEPFRLDGRDGYLYGRGISDNKGPILAAACAVSQLLAQGRLQTDVVFLIEGEEENGSLGFIEAVRKYKREIGDIDVILLSNSYWLDEETPCLTVGLRGVVRATVKVSSDEPDVHSGVEGGAIREPMVDMVKLLSSLTHQDQVALPAFYDSVRKVTPEERALYDWIVQIKRSGPSSRSSSRAMSTAETSDSLMAKWRFPSLSVHNIRVSGPGNSTVIPSSVSANVSIRIVPDQDLATIEESLRSHVTSHFNALTTSENGKRVRTNKVYVSVDHRADWWLGSTSSQYFRILHSAVQQEWNAEPISIREGGSIPAIAILEKELGASAVHLPMGQSSDSAHLPNERIRLVNLQKGKAVVRRFLEGLGALG